jgi:TPR repeat protein
MQLDGMQQTAILPASRPFAVGRAGFDYFADAQHYRSLAGRILVGLQQSGRIALVTADPPINPLGLATALTEATAGKHIVLTIACGGESKEEGEQLRRAAGTSPLLLFHQADRLSDGQLKKLCSYLASGGDRPAGVLLGRADFVLRLENLQPNLFKNERAIRFDLYELGRDEIDAFIRRQLRASKVAGGFAADEINWIADLSAGDPVQVNRLSRLMLELAGGGVGAMRGDSTPQQASSRSASRLRRGVLLCLCIGVLLILADGPEFGGGIDAPAESSSDSSPVPERAAASPPAIVASPPFPGIAAPPEPVAAPPFPEIAAPAEPATAPSSAETAAPAEPAASPSSGETAAPAEPAASPPSAETAAPAEPAVSPPSAETAAPAEPAATPSSAETAAPAEPATAPPSGETMAPAEPAASPLSAETAAPAEPAATPSSGETGASAEPAASPPSAETAAPAEPAASPPSAETAAPAEPAASPPSAETAAPAEPAASPPSAETAAPAEPVPAPAETAPQGVSVAATADKASTPLLLPAEQITALLARGDEFVRMRDIASARLLYERAADAGNGRAALRMGESFDPAFLDRIGIYRMAGDRQLALSWYRRARDLGDAEAAQLLEKSESR